ncbi:hypothetical protein KF840_18315 [bacterium]|nr:hypothetical protein [bacterium]
MATHARQGRPCIFGRGTRWLLAIALAIGFGVPATARGQEADELILGELMADGAHPSLRVLGEGGFVYQGDADIDKGGSLQVYRYDLGLAGGLGLMDHLRWGNTFFFGVNDYDFGGGSPWNVIYSMRLGSKLTYDINQQWGVSAGGILMFSPEDGANWGDSVSGGGLLAAEYRHSDTLFAGVGVAVITQIEDDPTVVPQVDLRWIPGPNWIVRLGGVPASGGAAASGEVAYQFPVPLEIGLGLLYQQRRFRLNDSSLAPNGVGVDNSLPLRVRLGWNFNEHIGLNVLAGAAFAGEVELEDSNGNRIASSNYDPAPYVGLRLAGAF